MSNLTQYQGIKYVKASLDYNQGQEATLILQVDFNKLTETVAHEINNFWGGEDFRLADSDNDIHLAVLKLAADHALGCLLDDSLYKADIFNQEGWGCYEYCGIKLVRFDYEEFEVDDCQIELQNFKHEACFERIFNSPEHGEVIALVSILNNISRILLKFKYLNANCTYAAKEFMGKADDSDIETASNYLSTLTTEDVTKLITDYKESKKITN